MLKAYSRPFIAELPNESELRVDFWNGARIKIYGSDNPDALRGRGFDMVVLDEYADMPPSLFPAVIRPALAEKNGRTIFIGTVRGRENHLWQTYQAAINDPDWYTGLLPASETGLIPEAELASARRDMGEDRYASEFECNSDSPIVGSYYGSLMRDADREGRVVGVRRQDGSRGLPGRVYSQVHAMQKCKSSGYFGRQEWPVIPVNHPGALLSQDGGIT